ncbi:Glutamyl-tRNA(Gln) amidotransferase subunit C protein [Thalictrum thalictroides]|uniref:Glutamyl-tRNA(Gln) amidotransferase subunit C, chloroplastic/mitochondrial n=1 Tax=Thalictrum thalictroides TaxID=46969 RepID=A0A7J6X869_THATH|nr:Glutamyl-tRNA(Gln) amidotransferase subunit C protein [Thalictrum thalictroides]
MAMAMASSVVSSVVKGRVLLVPHVLQQQSKKKQIFTYQPLSLPSRLRYFSAAAVQSSLLPPPDVSRLAETARISLTEKEVEEFAPKIQQVIDWFGQLQAVDLESIEPALRADAEEDNLRENVPETFENREALIAAVPNYEDPYIIVPKVLNKD